MVVDSNNVLHGLRVAIMDDSPQDALHLDKILTSAGCSTTVFNDSIPFLRALALESFDVMLFDWEMQGRSGVDTLVWIRQALSIETPVIFITNRGSERDIVEGLDAGANDYIIKPARHAELLGRIKAATRTNSASLKRSGNLIFGVYEFLQSESKVHFLQDQVNLTPKEWALSILLFNNLDKPLSRSHIQLAVWGNEVISSRSMDAHLSRLRTKLKFNTEETGVYLMPIYNFGYRLGSNSRGNRE